MRRPSDMFDREWEWKALTAFARDERPGATLGIVRGRRRQGKTFLVHALADSTKGFYHEFVQAEPPESLRRLGTALGAYSKAPGSIALGSFEEAFEALLRLGNNRPVTVVLDEFPWLATSVPSAASILMSALGPRHRTRRASRTRFLISGSAVSFMAGLLSGDSPLRGRAGLELIVSPFDYQRAAEFWGAGGDPTLALSLFAVVGGTPAYRREFVRDDVPQNREDFDDWIIRSVLDPSVPLFHEGRYLLSEDPSLDEIRDRAFYHSTLAAVAAGHGTRGGIANWLERRSVDVGHPLSVLQEAGLVRKEEDAFRRARPVYRIAEPFLRFHHAVVRPRWSDLERPGSARRVWFDSEPVFRSKVLGPAFEEICREWTRTSFEARAGAPVEKVAAGVLNDRKRRTTHQVDVVALGPRPEQGPRPILLIGEAKLGRRAGAEALARLVRIRDLLEERPDFDVAECRLALFSAGGFASDFATAARKEGALLLTIEDLYGTT